MVRCGLSLLVAFGKVWSLIEVAFGKVWSLIEVAFGKVWALIIGGLW